MAVVRRARLLRALWCLDSPRELGARVSARPCAHSSRHRFGGLRSKSTSITRPTSRLPSERSNPQQWRSRPYCRSLHCAFGSERSPRTVSRSRCDSGRTPVGRITLPRRPPLAPPSSRLSFEPGCNFPIPAKWSSCPRQPDCLSRARRPWGANRGRDVDVVIDLPPVVVFIAAAMAICRPTSAQTARYWSAFRLPSTGRQRYAADPPGPARDGCDVMRRLAPGSLASLVLDDQAGGPATREPISMPIQSGAGAGGQWRPRACNQRRSRTWPGDCPNLLA